MIKSVSYSQNEILGWISKLYLKWQPGMSD